MWDQQFDPPAWAVITGAISGVVVVDFDGDAGNATMRALGLTPHVRTGSGGHHVYFEHPGWHVSTVNSKAKRALGERYPGLDIRADGGYAIFAGRTSAGEYVWLREMVPDPLDVLPDEVRAALGLLVPPPPTQDAFGNDNSGSSQARAVWAGKILDLAIHRVPDHGRNNAGFWLSCQLRDNGYSSDEAEVVLQRYVASVPPTNTKGQVEPYTLEEARSSLHQAYVRQPREPWSRPGSAPAEGEDATDECDIDLPTVEVGNRELREVSRNAIDALRARNNPPRLFVRSGQMVHVVSDEKGRHGIREVSQDYLRGRLTRSANFRRVWLDRGGNRSEIAVNPPLDVVRDILALPPSIWRFPPIESVSEAPIFRPDGTIIVTPGYDAQTRVAYTPPPGFRLPKISDNPTPEEIDDGVCLIEEMLAGFPFVDPASKANTFAMLLTPTLRRAIGGNVPVALIDAPHAGNGKSLLAEILSLIHTGNNAAMQPAPVKEEEEWRKVITSIVALGHGLGIFDNLASRLDSPSFALVITASVWADRMLGTNKWLNLPQRTTWIVTGNNILLGGDLPRRSYRIRLDAAVPRPWQRTGFRIPNLKEWVLERRSELLGALLTITRSWYAAGKPEGESPILGSFEEWCKTIGGILRHVSILGFLDDLDDLYEESDPTEHQWEMFLREIFYRFNGRDFAVNDLVAVLRPDQSFHAMLPDDLVDDDRKGSNLFHRKVGNAFRQRVDRRYGPYGVHLARVGKDKSAKVARWRVEYQDEPPNARQLLAPPAWPAPWRQDFHVRAELAGVRPYVGA